MSWSNLITTTLLGRRIGLQNLSTNVSGSGVSGRNFDLITGPEAIKSYASSAESTASNLPAYGVSILTTSTGATTSSIYKLDPPIQGVMKTITIISTNTATNMVCVQASTGATITIRSSQGTTMCMLQSTGGVGASVTLVGISSTEWAVVGTLSTDTMRATTASC